MVWLQNTVHSFNTKIDSPSEKNETQKFLWWFAIALSLKVWK